MKQRFFHQRIVAVVFAISGWLALTNAFLPHRASADDLQSAVATKFAEIQQREMYNEKGELYFPGGTLAVSLPNGKTLTFASGFEDVEKRIPMTAERRMLSGSVGKMFAGALATRLIIDGRLDPDAKISRFFHNDAWFAELPNKDDITIRHLLQHSSGLISYYEQPDFIAFLRRRIDMTLPGYNADWWLDFNQVMEYAIRRPALFPVGSGFSYSENGYQLLGAILGKVLAGNDAAQEVVFRKAYYQGLNRLILNPLSLYNTTPLVGRRHANLSQGYPDGHPAFTRLFHKMITAGALVVEPRTEFTGGGLVTSVADLARGVRGLAKGLMLARPDRQSQFKALFTSPGPKDDHGNYYGFGPHIVENSPADRIIGHGGMFPGYRSLTLYFEKMDLAVAIQVNSDRNERLPAYVREILMAITPLLD